MCVCLVCFICHSQNTSFLTGLRLGSRSSQGGQPLSLGDLLLPFFFGLLHSLGQKFSIFCSLFFIFLSTLFLRAIRRRLCCRARGVTRRWILGALVLGFLPSLFRGFRTTYWRTSSSLERLKSLRILLALLGRRQRGTVVSMSPGISFSPFFTMTGVHNATPYRFALSPVLLGLEQECPLLRSR